MRTQPIDPHKLRLERGAKRALQTTQAHLLAQVCQLATLCGWLVYHRRESHGFPNLCLVRPPEVLFIEVKSDSGRVTPAQDVWLQALAFCGLDVAVWRPADLETIVTRLQRPTTSRRSQDR